MNEPAIRHRETVPESLLELLQAYPFKSFQYDFLRIPKAGVARYQYEAFQRVDLSRQAFYTLEDSRGARGCFALSRHGWHSDLFRVECYRTGHLLAREPSEATAKALARGLSIEADSLGAELTGARVDAEDLAMQNALAREDFSLVGHSVKLALRGDRLDISLLNRYASGENSGFAARVRLYDPSDLGALRAIAQDSHEFSHYFNDPILKGRGVERLFPEWVEKCARGAAAAILIIEGNSGEGVVGFVTLLLNQKLATYTGSTAGVIDFIAIDPARQGKGLGKQLTAAALLWLVDRSDYIEVRTEQVNFTAIRLYRSLGLELVSADVDFHRWGVRRTD